MSSENFRTYKLYMYIYICVYIYIYYMYISFMACGVVVREKSLTSKAPQKIAISDSFHFDLSYHFCTYFCSVSCPGFTDGNRFLEVGGGMASISNVLLMPCPQKWKHCSSTILYHSRFEMVLTKGREYPSNSWVKSLASCHFRLLTQARGCAGHQGQCG